MTITPVWLCYVLAMICFGLSLLGGRTAPLLNAGLALFALAHVLE